MLAYDERVPLVIRKRLLERNKQLGILVPDGIPENSYAIVLKEDLTNLFVREWGYKIKPFMKKGWVTWFHKERWDSSLTGCFPENNKYMISFKKTQFKRL